MKEVLIKSENNFYHFEGVTKFKKRGNFYFVMLKDGTKMYISMQSIIYIAVREAKQ